MAVYMQQQIGGSYGPLDLPHRSQGRGARGCPPPPPWLHPSSKASPSCWGDRAVMYCCR